MVAGTLAVLCILQASLNIILRLSHKCSDPPVSIQGPKTTCPEGWQRFRSSCYYVDTLHRDWNSGKEYCKSEGGHLVIVNSPEEKDFLYSLTRDQIAWIGLEKNRRPTGLMWVDGKHLTAPYGIRPLTRIDEGCAVFIPSLDQELDWFSIDCCHDQAMSVCEKPAI